MPWRCFASRFSALPSPCEESHNCSAARPRNALPLLRSAICAIPMPSNSVHHFAFAMLCSAFPPQYSAPHRRCCAKKRGAIPSRFNVRHIDSALSLCDSIQCRALPLPCHPYLAPLCLRSSMPSSAFLRPSMPFRALAKQNCAAHIRCLTLLNSALPSPTLCHATIALPLQRHAMLGLTIAVRCGALPFLCASWLFATGPLLEKYCPPFRFSVQPVAFCPPVHTARILFLYSEATPYRRRSFLP